MHQITLEYYAQLREQAGRAGETVSTAAASPQALYEELRARHGFTLPRAMLRVAVNDAFCGWDQALAEGDRVVFIPPVSGG